MFSMKHEKRGNCHASVYLKDVLGNPSFAVSACLGERRIGECLTLGICADITLLPLPSPLSPSLPHKACLFFEDGEGGGLHGVGWGEGGGRGAQDSILSSLLL